MQIYIHIGMHKTGTTSIQQTLRNNTEELKKLGYLAFVNPHEMWVLTEEDFDPIWLRQQVEITKRDELKAIIFSAEFISILNSQQLNRLISVFEGNEIILVSCFRHWVSFLPSRWAQNCSRRDTQSFSTYLENLRVHADVHIDARFDLVVQRMIATNVKDIRIISYDNAILTDSLLSTCLFAFDLPEAFVNSVQKEGDRYNVSKSVETTELIRLFNGVHSLQHSLEANALFLGLGQIVSFGVLYDFSRKIAGFLNNNNELKTELLSLLKTGNEMVFLLRTDRHIATWESKVEEAAREYLVNPCESKLFGNIPHNEFECSNVEVGDIPLDVQKQMLKAF
jgi:hypothetical protein